MVFNLTKYGVSFLTIQYLVFNIQYLVFNINILYFVFSILLCFCCLLFLIFLVSQFF